MFSSYGKCVEKAMKDKFLTWIGCTPPWFPDQTDVCQGSVYIKEYRECMIAKYVDEHATVA